MAYIMTSLYFTIDALLIARCHFRKDINDKWFFWILMMCANIKIQVNVHLRVRLVKIGYNI